MYHQPLPTNGARAAYRDVDLGSRIESASPHGLIGILFEELLNALGVAKASLRAGGNPGHSDGARRANQILVALEASLVPEQGREIAAALASVYRESRRLVAEAIRTRSPEPLDAARRMIAEIATAWAAIG